MTVLAQPDPGIGPAEIAPASSPVDAADQERPADAAPDQVRAASSEPGGSQQPAASAGAYGTHVVAGRYRLIEPLGRGGMGRVYLAHDDLLDRPIAVKLIYDDAVSIRDQRQACAVEARAAARVSHPGVVRILDSGFDDGHCFVVMELAEGKTLAEILRERGALPIARALGIAAQVADALEAAHLQGVVHCDVKPGNLIVDSVGRVRLVDFGIARVANGSTGLTDQDVHGSAKYVAPEQVEGAELDGRTDLYALGVVLFEMLAGQPPFESGNLASVLAQRLVADPPSVQALRPAVPDDVERIVRRAMAREPGRRFGTAGDLREALRAAHARQQDAERAFWEGTALDWTVPVSRPGRLARTSSTALSQAGVLAGLLGRWLAHAASLLVAGAGALGDRLSTALPYPAPAFPGRWPSLPSAVGILALLGLLSGMAAAQCGMAGVSIDAPKNSALAARPGDASGQALAAPAAEPPEPPVAAAPPPTLIPAPTVVNSEPAVPTPTRAPSTASDVPPAEPTPPAAPAGPALAAAPAQPSDAPPVQALAVPAAGDRLTADNAGQPASDDDQPPAVEQVKQRGNGPPDEKKQPEAAKPSKPAPAPPAAKPQGGPPGQVKKQTAPPPPAAKPQPGGGNAQHGGGNGGGNGNGRGRGH
jgi:serine/threonine-protein kinase